MNEEIGSSGQDVSEPLQPQLSIMQQVEEKTTVGAPNVLFIYGNANILHCSICSKA